MSGGPLRVEEWAGVVLSTCVSWCEGPYKVSVSVGCKNWRGGSGLCD